MKNNQRTIDKFVILTVICTAVIFFLCGNNPIFSGLSAGFILCLTGVLINVITFRKAIMLFHSLLLYIPFLFSKIAAAGVFLSVAMSNGAYPHYIAIGILLGIIYSSVLIIKIGSEGNQPYGSR